ncbi:hypothetical protein DFP72DRAFT_883456 [Ephemerocybe angulata]|uniref:Zn(2)-C6 fungal-type domain-containing protein n=1 Tax=Ephemerocybe angulata TaxID=980116 RepID=A0A8H6I771_9AGAR|nr:hypothetical protein DFP72DRAFT_883456 [Tulosesus angulatus]
MNSDSGQGSKVKKTRRRLRLSCVECTKRRQKCDRSHPCGLCVARGVANMCRWETVPMARPAPSRPPETAIRYIDGIAQHDTIVKDLQDRIATLEQALAEQRGTPYRTSPPSTSSSSFRSIPLPEIQKSPPADWELIKDAPRETSTEASRQVSIPPVAATFDPRYSEIDIASTAHLCLAQHGEFVGRGSLICALHSITNRTAPRFIYAKSTDSIFEGRDNMERFSPLPYASHTVHQLLSKLPHKAAYDALVESYFFNLNWRYGIPRPWFNRASGQMWSRWHSSNHLSSEINANFLTLVFSILAAAPRDDEMEASLVLSCDDYFMCAMISRRIAEDDYFNTPRASTMVSPADGTVLGCLATPILASFLSERGRVVGNGVRNALAVGLHRDANWKLWQVMSQEEKMLRKRAWWTLFIADRWLSYMLGRPHMIREEMYDVELPSSTNEDGAFDLFGFNQRIMIELATLLGEAIDSCYSPAYPHCGDFLAMDAKLEAWRNSVPQEYQESLEITSLRGYEDPEISILARQRYILNTWYLASRLKLHIASTTGPTPKTCISVAVELIEYQCDFHDGLIEQFRERERLHYAYLASGWLFHGCFSLFEACVALLATKERVPYQDMVPGAMEALDRTMQVLTSTAKHEAGKGGSIATMAINVLRPLHEQHFSVSQSGASHGGSMLKSLFDGLQNGNADLNWLTSMSRKEAVPEAFPYGQPVGFAVALG